MPRGRTDRKAPCFVTKQLNLLLWWYPFYEHFLMAFFQRFDFSRMSDESVSRSNDRIYKHRLLYQPVGRVMPLKVLNEHLVYAVRSRWVTAGVSHGASTAIEILPHYHRNFPQSWIRSRGTGWYHAVVEEFIIERVRPAGRTVLINRHGGVVREICVPQHLEHVVSADLKTFYIYNINVISDFT